MSDYHDLDSHWYCAMSVSLASRAARRDAEEVIEWTRKLLAHDYDAEAATRLARAETALSEALLAVKVARAEYERKRPVLQAAE